MDAIRPLNSAKKPGTASKFAFPPLPSHKVRCGQGSHPVLQPSFGTNTSSANLDLHLALNIASQLQSEKTHILPFAPTCQHYDLSKGHNAPISKIQLIDSLWVSNPYSTAVIAASIILLFIPRN